MFLDGNGNANHLLGTGFLIRSAVKKAEFVSDRVSYIILRGCWCDIVLIVHTPAEDNFCEELEQILHEHFVRRFRC
jgi:hypothetical protein